MEKQKIHYNIPVSAILLAFVLVFSLGEVRAQKTKDPVPTWHLTYGLDVPHNNQKKDLKQQALVKAILAAGEEENRLSVAVSKDFARVLDRSESATGYYLIPKKDSLQYYLDTVGRTVTRIVGGLPEVVTVGDSVIAVDPNDFKMKLLDDTQKINGYLCHKATFESPLGTAPKIVVWYSKEIPVFYWGKYSYLKKLPGAALAIYMDNGKMKIGMKVKSIEKRNVSSAYFQVPQKYKLQKF